MQNIKNFTFLKFKDIIIKIFYEIVNMSHVIQICVYFSYCMCFKSSRYAAERRLHSHGFN